MDSVSLHLSFGCIQVTRGRVLYPANLCYMYWWSPKVVGAYDEVPMLFNWLGRVLLFRPGLLSHCPRWVDVGSAMQVHQAWMVDYADCFVAPWQRSSSPLVVVIWGMYLIHIPHFLVERCYRNPSPRFVLLSHWTVVLSHLFTCTFEHCGLVHHICCTFPFAPVCSFVF